MPIAGSIAGQSQTGSPPQSPELFPFRGLLHHLMPMERVRELYRRAQQPINHSIMENVLTEMNVEFEISDCDMLRIPTSGPVVVTANHPFGILDGAVLGALLYRVRSDVKIVTNFLLEGIPELHEHCIFVDPFDSPDSLPANRRALKRAIAWLQNGGMLAMFPAGEVSHLHVKQLEVIDPEWNPAAARLARMTDAAALPVFFRGRNSVPFQAVGLLHPKLRTVWLLNEFLQQTDRKVDVCIGSPIPTEIIQHARSDRDAVNYLRWRTYLLAERGSSAWHLPPALKSVWPAKRQEPIAEAPSRRSLLDDLQRLPAERCVEENREFRVYVAEAHEIPKVMQELGRLREVTFRASGEGTGKRTDLDRFDRHYRHVVLWSKTNSEVVGAYRLGLTTEILPRFGVGGLYTNTLFRFDSGVFSQLGPALELGRSFVRPEYQRQFAPLHMLWKGIGRLLVARPEFATLFGAVSISSRYNRASRELIVRFFRQREQDTEIARLVTPRHPFRPRWRKPETQPECGCAADLQELPIADIETDGKGLPILLKHYAKLGGRIVSFNVDRQFSDVLDGLVLVDLRKTSPAVLERYMGKDGIGIFRRYHGLTSSTIP